MSTMDLSVITTQSWFTSLPQLQQILVINSLELLEREKKLDSSLGDYAFILFPLSKAYEGFLKEFLLELGLISQNVYEGRRFRIGRALNPDISINQRDKWWLYDNIVENCGEEMARTLWNGWIECRNHVFHFFPNRQNTFTLEQVEKKIELLLTIFDQAWACQIKNRPSSR